MPPIPIVATNRKAQPITLLFLPCIPIPALALQAPNGVFLIFPEPLKSLHVGICPSPGNERAPAFMDCRRGIFLFFWPLNEKSRPDREMHLCLTGKTHPYKIIVALSWKAACPERRQVIRKPQQNPQLQGNRPIPSFTLPLPFLQGGPAPNPENDCRSNGSQD